MYNIGTNGAYVTVYSYKYDSAGRLFSVTDHQNNECTRYVYDFGGNLLKSYTADTATDQIKSSETFRYDEQSRLSNTWQQLKYSYSGGIGDAFVNYTYFYDETTGKLDALAVGSMGFGATLQYTIDNFGRTNQKIVSGTNFYNTYSYDFKTNDVYESALVSQLISQVKTGENGSVIAGTTYNYSYDQNGNITHIKDASGVVQYRYTYDGLGQLTREDNRPLGYSYRYLYDDAGNITNKIRYAFTTGTLGTATSTVTYGYNDATWGDLLTSYDGVNIEYDALGNPKYIIESENGDYVSGKWLEWEGRQLKAYHTAYGYSGELDEIFESIEFYYNADGIRIGKNVYGTEYEYIVSGSQILAEKWQYGSYGHFMQYLYDESGAPIGLNYRSNSYAEDVFDVFYFEKNLQGDIVAIYNDSGVRIGTYTYDAWGNFTVSTASGITSLERSIVHTYNPFRYRGYYYDVDMGMYYLQSRYYNPQWGRFLNADGQLNEDLLGYNMFAYCSNNPVNRVDHTGEAWWHWAAAAAVVVGCLAATVVTCGGSLAGAAMAIGMVASGSAALTTASTVAAAATIGSGMVLGAMALDATINSESVEEFADRGNWGTVAGTGMGMLGGGVSGWSMASNQLDKTFLPNEYYTNKKAPTQGTPNSSYTNYKYNDYLGKFEKSTAYYDFAGRQCIRIDWTNHGYSNHGNPHVHYTSYTAQFPYGTHIRMD